MRVGLVSFRLGGLDGVAIEAAKWANALAELGHQVVTVAGEGPVDRRLAGLAATADEPPSVHELTDALGDVDLVVVENLVSLPLNVAAREVCYRVLAGRPAILRHHDLAWQRESLAHLEGPRDDPRWVHVTINERSRLELAARGVVATTLYNAFDCDPPLGRRAETRASLGVGDERLLLLASRAIARKNVAGAFRLAARLGATLWLLGPPDDGYDDELERLVGAADVEVRRGPVGSIDDAYAASDLVVVPSFWEGFGNPTLESVTHRRPLAAYPYPVLGELRARGLSFFDLEDVADIESFLDDPDERRYERNLAIARRDFNLANLASRLEALVAAAVGPVG